MTVFGWDASHYDDVPQGRDGIDFYTHKLTDGDHYYLDPEYARAMVSANNLDIPILGAYHVLHGTRSIASQASWFVQKATELSPYWQTHNCFIWQVDAEPFSYLTAPTIDEINAFGDAVCKVANCPTERFVAYAPQWWYGDSLARLRYRWWSSKYGTNLTGWYKDVYPGDNSIRWNGPVNPLFLQYGSNTTIAGQTTCDANAYRGNLVDLLGTLRAKSGGQDMTPEEHGWLGETLTLVRRLTSDPWQDYSLIRNSKAAADGVKELLDKSVITEEQISSIANQIGQQLVESTNNPLSETHKQEVVDAVKQALREGIG